MGRPVRKALLAALVALALVAPATVAATETSATFGKPSATSTFGEEIVFRQEFASPVPLARVEILLDDDVAGAVAALPEDFRTVVILCDIEGLSYEEIAEFINIPLGTVRSRLHRGRKLLRDRLLTYARKRGYAPKD